MKILSISLAPFVSGKRAFLALGQILKFWKYPSIVSDVPFEVFDFFSKYFPGKELELVGTGREAFLKILLSLNLPRGSKVALQVCTCVVLPKSVQKAGLKPVWVDIDTRNLNMDLKQLEEKLISDDIKVVVTQDAFGIAVDRNRMIELKSKHGFIWIEDLAHSFGNIMDKQYLGNFGDYAFLSFGRDKMFSACSGGMIISNERIDGQALKWSFWDVFRFLLYEILMPFAKLGCGIWTKFWTRVFFGFGLLPKVVTKDEKCGAGCELSDVRGFPSLFLPFLKYEILRWEENAKARVENRHRIEKIMEIMAVLDKKIYYFDIPKDQILLRYPITWWEKAKDFLKFCAGRGVYLGDWYSHVIDPKGVNLSDFGYEKGLCPVAEEVCPSLINFPLYSWLMEKDFKRINILLKEFVEKG